ncbi:MAG: hypothetical protein HFF66_00680 [Oscillospiraceae bacterium]|mgnify:CR=1 FL=1|jgi:microcystin-dependent protein|nr:hypothetical protein [Oscillospiraceae bacterium]
MELMYKRQSLGLEGVPSGCILAYSGEAETVPEGWAVCDGQNGTPDLRGRFILGVSETHPMGETGGAEEVTLTAEQLPSHSHKVNYTTIRYDNGTQNIDNSIRDSGLGNPAGQVNTRTTGGSQPHPNMPPYYALIYIMKL